MTPAPHPSSLAPNALSPDEWDAVRRSEPLSIGGQSVRMAPHGGLWVSRHWGESPQFLSPAAALRMAALCLEAADRFDILALVPTLQRAALQAKAADQLELHETIAQAADLLASLLPPTGAP